MADEKKTYLLNVEDNLKELSDHAAKAKKAMDDFKIALDNAKKSGTTSTAEIEKLNAAHRNAQKEYKATQKAIEAQLTLLNKESTYREKLVASRTIEIAKLKELGNGYIKNAQGLDIVNPKYIETTKRIGDINKAIIENDQSMNDGRTNVGRYGESVTAAFSSAGKSILSMLSPMALVAAGIAAARKLFEGFKEVVMSMTGVINVMNNAHAITKQMYYDLATSLQFHIDKMIVARDIQQQLNELRVDEGWKTLKLSQINREEQKVREESIDRTKTHTERLELLNKVTDLESQKTAVKVEHLKKEVSTKLDLLKLQPANEKLMQNILNLMAQINDAYAEEDSAMRRVNTQRTGFMQEEIDNRKKLFADYYDYLDKRNIAIDKAAEKEKDIAKQEVKDQIILRILEADGDSKAMKEALKFRYDEEIKMTDLTATQKLIKKAEYDKAIKNLDEKAVKDAKAALDKEVEENKKALDKKQKDAEDLYNWNLARILINEENLLKIRELNGAWEFDIQRAQLKKEYNAEIENAKKTGADITIINKKYQASQRKIDALELNAKLSAYANFAGNIATIFGKNTAIGRVAAVAQTTIATFQAGTEAYKAMAGIPYVGPALGIVAAAAAIAAGLANVKEILAVKSGLPGDSGGGSVAMPTAITASSAAIRTAPIVGSTILTQPQLTQSQLNVLPNQNLLTANDIAEALSKMPAPIVTVEDINVRQNEVNKVAVRANI